MCGMDLNALQKKSGHGFLTELARKVGAHPGYISQCSIGYRKPSVRLAKKLVAADKRLTLKALRPDIFGTAA